MSLAPAPTPDDHVREHLRTDIRDGVLTLTINRPDAKNALTLAMRQHLEALCAGIDADDTVSAVVLRATGSVFCAGADIKEIAAYGPGLPATNPGAALRSVRKPVICAVGGACVTGGLELALSCDWIVASEQAFFADTHARLGVLPRWGLSALLPRTVGVRFAKEMSATGRRVNADEALRVGLVNAVVPHSDLDAYVLAQATAAAAVPCAALAATFALYDEGDGDTLTEALAREHTRAAAWSPSGGPFSPGRTAG
ncbi:enoyl-CoA hydratase-related protein [Yinghuangia soli]|uniref:Enoyl-CoA hydratase-related protein n=1 Tax=Yinghuangia soli TaxID=2908204 RepID=A0AA41PXF4_9ACTN|nr:enoyl-CoA hydratase-related protein [Yinghuangia soli]MCF2526986.1 enoyl-CoA hydratase-related protein [Yinghuangia soli]